MQKYLRDKNNGHILTPDGLRFICQANNYDPEKIGRLSWSSIIVTLGSINLRCKSLLKRSKIVIIGVRSQVVVPNKDIATHGMIQLIVRAELMLINQFLLEGMIESLYRSIIIRTAGFTHTLRNPT